MNAKADLHVHSRHSDRPSEWILRRIGAPESFTEPLEVYDRCRAAGMDFVTISDHNCIRGALEIAHLPGTFLSNEVTTYFPEDRCKIHCLVIGIDERQFEEIQRVRTDIYDFRDYLIDEEIVYSVAHPLYSVNNRLTVEHFEKLLVLFKRFEGINGARDPHACGLARAIFDRLTPEVIDRLAEHHRLEPREPEPWKKVLTGGSDDHGGLYIASAYTETPEACTVEHFLQHLRDYDHTCGGTDGTSLELARSFYSIGYRFYRDRLLSEPGRRTDLIDGLFHQLLRDESGAATSSTTFSIKQTLRSLVRPKVNFEAFDQQIFDELVGLLRDEAKNGSSGETAARRCFRKASRLSHQLTTSAIGSAIGHLEKGRIVESLQTASSLAPLALCIAPYAAAFQTQHKDRQLLAAVAESWAVDEFEPPRRVAWFTDTFGESNGVARTIETFARAAEDRGDALTVFTCLDEAPEQRNVRNFRPTGHFEFAEYRGQVMRFPPFLDVVRECERLGVTELVISTPGPLGATGLAAARMLNLRATGIYHTDFPAYVRSFTDSPALEQWTWSLMRLFFDQMDTLFVPSQIYVEDLAERGFDRQRMRLLPRGVDLGRFGTRFQDPTFRDRFGRAERRKFLSVGRVSREKNLDVALEAFLAICDQGVDADMIIVGDGPYREELERRHASERIHFTGALNGDELATAYASSDVFVFASRTDTFGNVVLEAQASGVPVVISDRCGAHEIVEQEGWGLVVNTEVPGPLAEAMTTLARDEEVYRSMRERALATVEARSHHRWADRLWSQIVRIEEGVGESATAPARATAATEPTGVEI